MRKTACTLGLALLTLAACAAPGDSDDTAEAAPSNLGATSLHTFKVAPFTKNARENYFDFLEYAVNTLEVNDYRSCEAPGKIAIAPDGRTVAYSKLWTAPGPWPQITACQMYVLDLPTGEARLISFNPTTKEPGDESARDPKFSDDGRYLFFYTLSRNFARFGEPQIPQLGAAFDVHMNGKLVRYDMKTGDIAVVSGEKTSHGTVYRDLSPMAWYPIEHGESYAFIDRRSSVVYKKNIATGVFTQLTRDREELPHIIPRPPERKVWVAVHFDLRETNEGLFIAVCDELAYKGAVFNGTQYITIYKPNYKPGTIVPIMKDPTPEEIESLPAVSLRDRACVHGSGLYLAKDDYIVYAAIASGPGKPKNYDVLWRHLIYGFDYKTRAQRMISSDDNGNFPDVAEPSDAVELRLSPDKREAVFEAHGILGQTGSATFVKNLETGKLRAIPHVPF